MGVMGVMGVMDVIGVIGGWQEGFYQISIYLYLRTYVLT